ncbi:fibrinolytic enzyme, isozyme C-like isoform X2 [Biomphalaria glabrata]|uniref:Fibrinolytic enzyme, isozyme C-like isoform X2 n=1 Tax=Biomphalaria glabrata TaxID=6526 RepID=A0A9W3B0D8_BIOGL|nr:fibrinolytic enzyme, isozyme C-like isoform X2 [Biomphalaria glabrata]
MNLLIATSLFLLLTDIDVTSSRARHSIGGFIKRIIYGTNAELYDIPSQVGIFYRRENNWTLECGGVLIKPDKVLTAAHCMKGVKAINVKVSVGMLNKFGPPTQYEQIIYVKRIKIHEDFDAKAILINDLAILTLANPAILNNNVKVAQLAVDSSDFFDKLCIVSGWGKSNYTDISGKNRLQKTSITLLSKEECISNWKLYSDRINDRQLVCVLDKQVDSPVVYTDVSQCYRSWIETNS